MKKGWALWAAALLVGGSLAGVAVEKASARPLCTIRPANCLQGCGYGLWNEWVQLTYDAATDGSGAFELTPMEGPCGSEWGGFTCDTSLGWRGVGTRGRCVRVEDPNGV